MTYTPKPDIEDVRFQSGGVFDFDFHFSIPDHVSTAAGGNANVSTSNSGSGVEVGGSSTSGDIAEIVGPNWLQPRQHILVTRIWYEDVPYEGPYDDHFLLGQCGTVGDDNFVAYLDLKNEEYVTAQTTTAASIATDRGVQALTIEQDFVTNKTVFTHKGEGVNETVTIETATRSRNNFVHYESTGAGEGLEIHHIQQRLIPKV
jgi:hypothetical protein